MALDLTFLTRPGCAATPTMLENLKLALRMMTHPPGVMIVDLNSLPSSDVRRGYPTPTLLVNNVDAFGLPSPVPPIPDPS